jgi:hypothetical protein
MQKTVNISERKIVDTFMSWGNSSDQSFVSSNRLDKLIIGDTHEQNTTTVPGFFIVLAVFIFNHVNAFAQNRYGVNVIDNKESYKRRRYPGFA